MHGLSQQQIRAVTGWSPECYAAELCWRRYQWVENEGKTRTSALGGGMITEADRQVQKQQACEVRKEQAFERLIYR